MSYGWKRTEIVGALVNGMFLLSLCLYVLLEAIPRFIRPPNLTEHSIYFLITAGSGIGINLFGAVLLGYLGIEAHQHAPGEHDHHGHGHGHHHHDEEEHSHSDEEHSHDEESPFMKAHKKKKHGKGEDHDHDHDHDHAHEHDHDHDHKEKKKDKKKHGKSWKCSRNMGAVFLHYVGDVLSSICVLITGLLMYFYPTATWPKYLDPASSVVIVGLVFFTTIGLVRECVSVLLQGVPKSVNMGRLRDDLKRIQNVLDVHDLHVWELSDGVAIASVHVDIMRDTSFDSVVFEVKEVFHRHGIHSTTVQPEYPNADASCVGCAVECKEDRCCVPDNNTAVLVDIPKDSSSSYGSINNPQ
jgi:solute carrier family 30 (zinc transporter), member 1